MPPFHLYKTKHEIIVGVCPTATWETFDVCQDLQHCQEDTCLEFFALLPHVFGERVLDGTDSNE